MTPLSILIVEDNTLSALLLRETLETAGHRIPATARTYHEALEAVGQHAPDLALIDIELEGSVADGVQTASKLVSMHPMPVIYLTGNAQTATFERAKLTTPAAYLIKPFRTDELLMQVELAYLHFDRQRPALVPVSDAVFLPVADGHERVLRKDVLYAQAAGSYTRLFRLNKPQPTLLSMNLSRLEEQFADANFYRASRSLLINLEHIERIARTEVYMHSLPTAVPISNEVRTDLMKQITVIRT